ncbi:uncharacterized protein LOC111404692 [Olea europaea var. sylvestris]|uniref:uncharacterized protein LOC111404692 n=1 Tax=Olea europaea var. sylvestris TaxID=158386 RepID=UPI000C1CCD50|nr:uncharacterized protein LOC111404692 [Olea europaea var. sylvestris]
MEVIEMKPTSVTYFPCPSETHSPGTLLSTAPLGVGKTQTKPRKPTQTDRFGSVFCYVLVGFGYWVEWSVVGSGRNFLQSEQMPSQLTITPRSLFFPAEACETIDGVNFLSNCR